MAKLAEGQVMVEALVTLADGETQKSGRRPMTPFKLGDTIGGAEVNAINRSRTLDVQGAIRSALKAKYDGAKAAKSRTHADAEDV